MTVSMHPTRKRLMVVADEGHRLAATAAAANPGDPNQMKTVLADIARQLDSIVGVLQGIAADTYPVGVANGPKEAE